MAIDNSLALAAEDMQAVNAFILEQLSSDVVLIDQIGHYIINSGGKRLRPLLVLLASRAAGHDGQKHIDLAAIIEFIHTATLLHDDVVDGSEQRRNQDTANQIWGNAASVLVGDFLYSRSFEMMVALREMRVMDILSHATNRIAEGEVLQLMNINDPDIGEKRYIDVIVRKTATLFEAGTRLAGVISEADEATEQALAAYGMDLGIAFQIVDDTLDYTGKDIGKNVGDDLEEGKPTLPLIRAMQTAAPEKAAVVRDAIENGGRDRIEEIMQIIRETDAIDYSIALARKHADAATRELEILPASPYRDALAELADFAVNRDY